MKKLLFLFCLPLTFLFSQGKSENFTLGGSVFIDYFYFLKSNKTFQGDSSGFQLRRVHFFSNFEIAKNLSSRILLESEQNNAYLTGTKFDFYIKDAYLKWTDFFEGATLTVGLAPTPGWQISEPAWNYRSVEKTIMDLNKIENSRDLGIDVSGNIIRDGSLKYWFKIGNNSGTSFETDKHRKYYSFFHFVPSKNFQTAVYLNYAKRNEKFDNYSKQRKSNDIVVSSLFINYSLDQKISFGGELFTRLIKNNFSKSLNSELSDENSWGISLWSWAVLTKEMNILFRYDYVEPNNNIFEDENSLIILGFDYHPISNFKIIPNLEWFSYKQQQNNQLVTRLTFAFYF